MSKVNDWHSCAHVDEDVVGDALAYMPFWIWSRLSVPPCRTVPCCTPRAATFFAEQTSAKSAYGLRCGIIAVDPKLEERLKPIIEQRQSKNIDTTLLAAMVAEVKAMAT